MKAGSDLPLRRSVSGNISGFQEKSGETSKVLAHSEIRAYRLPERKSVRAVRQLVQQLLKLPEETFT